MAQNIQTIERDGLRMHVFVSEPTIFRVTSVVLEGRHELALIDAQFSADNALRLVGLIKSLNKKLTTIFISYSDPDYYFGLDYIARNFPDAKIFSTPQIRHLIDATKDEKINIWAPQLGENAPEKIIVPQALMANYFTLENRHIEIRKTVGDEQHSFLWIPSVRTVLGGVYLVDNQHVWMADSPTKEDRAKWLRGLDSMAKLRPEFAIPAHFIPEKNSFKNTINFTKDYLINLEAIIENSKNSHEIIYKADDVYPGLGGRESLEMTAKVLGGEMSWRSVAAFPAIGRKAEVDFGGEYVFELDFHDDRTMTFRGLREREKGRPVTDTVRYTAVEIAPRVYMVYWTETDNTHVVHIEDFGRGVVYTNITAPDGSFTNFRGSLKLLGK